MNRNLNLHNWLAMLTSDLISAGELFSSGTTRDNIMIREGMVSRDFHFCSYKNILLDTGASSANYIGDNLFNRSPIDVRACVPCNHIARLGDGKTKLTVNRKIRLDLHLYEDDNLDNEKLVVVKNLEFLVIPFEGFRDQIIIGRPTILGPLLQYFVNMLLRLLESD